MTASSCISVGELIVTANGQLIYRTAEDAFYNRNVTETTRDESMPTQGTGMITNAIFPYSNPNLYNHTD